MRARSLKPGLFKNELLGSADPLLTILFEGLWCMADREGRLEDRPLRICAEIFPYRRGVTDKRADTMLAWLHDHLFLVRYEVHQKRYIEILGFTRHQRPHVNEPPSIIQQHTSLDALPKAHRASTIGASDSDNGSKGFALTPDSGLLTPDSGLLTDVSRTSHQGAPSARRAPSNRITDSTLHEAEIRSGYPEFVGRQDWGTALHHLSALVDSGVSWTELIAATHRYAAFVAAGGVSGPRYVFTPSKFFAGQRGPWREEWKPPLNKAEQRLAGNLSAADEFMRATEPKQ